MIYIYDKSGNLLFGGNAEVKLKRRVMGEETLTVTIVSATAIAFDYGAYADALGERYYLHINPKVDNNGKYNSYTLVMESAKYKLGFAQMQSFGRADYDLTTDLEGWVKLIVANANRDGSGWSYVINDPDTNFKTLRVDGEKCLASINRIYTDFGKEFKVVGKQIVVGRVGSDLSNVLKVGRYEGLYNVTEEQNGTSSPITRLYVYGGERNIPSNYRNPDGTTITPRLVMDAVNGGKRYIEQNVDKYGVIEDSVTFDEIYPHRTGLISSVNASDVQEFYDTSMDFDVNGQMLPGITPKVCFLTGDLAGYTFDLVSYDNTGKKFRLAVGNDGGGRELPNVSLKPKAGDKYTLVDLAMPSSYVTAGETELLAKGQETIATRSVFQSTFTATNIDPVYQQDVNFYPIPGDRLGIASNGVTKQVRIIEQTISLTSPVKIYESLAFADKVEPTALAQAANSAKATSDSIYIANKGAKDAQTKIDQVSQSATAAVAGSVKLQSATAQEVQSPMVFRGRMDIYGDIYQNGTAYETHAQHIFSANDFMTLRDGAVTNLSDGSYTGFQSKRVFADGSDGFLVFGSDGMARVGKQASLQMLATREDAPLADGVAKWDLANKRYKSVAESTLSVGDSAKLGGRAAADYWHKDNLNRSDIDFTARNVTTNGYIVVDKVSDDILLLKSNGGLRYDLYYSGGSEGANNSGKNLTLYCYGNSGEYLGAAFTVNRADRSFIFYSTAQSDTYSGSGFTATGWKIGYYSNLLNLDVRGRLQVYEMVSQKINISNGNILVTDSVKATAVNSYTVNGETITFAVNDFVVSTTNGYKSGYVTAVTSTTFTMASASYSGNLPAVGDLWVRKDNTSDANRRGLLYLNATDTNNPNFQVLYANDVRAQLGNIAGRVIDGQTIADNRYGLWFKNAAYYEDGSAKVSGGNIAWDSTGATNIGRGAIQISADGTDITFSDKVKMQWQSGGRNYAPNSKETIIAAGSNQYNFYTIPYCLEANTVYTFSAEASVVSGSITYYTILLYDLTNSIGGPSALFTVGTRSKFTFTSPNSSLFRILVYAGVAGYTANNSIKLIRYKLEKGYNATDWIPALEDVDSKLTRIDANGIYTGSFTANQIIGDNISGKTINAVNASNATIMQLHGTNGTLTGFDDSGVMQSQLSRGSLTFFDSLGVPAVFLRNSTISLSECKNGGSIYATSAGSIDENSTAYSGEFSISTLGAYKGAIPMSLSASGSIDVDGHNDSGYTNVNCSVSVSVSVDLEWKNPSTGLFESYIKGVAYANAYSSTNTTSASCSSSAAASLGFTASKTGTFRFKFTHTNSCYGNAWDPSRPSVYFDVIVTSLTSTASNTGSINGSKVSNGTYIGTNGFVAYNAESGEKYLAFDKSQYYALSSKANSCFASPNENMKVYVEDDSISIYASGVKFKVTSGGRIYMYNVPGAAVSTDGTGANRYRLYLDENSQLCKSPNNGW